jgi:cysteine desulfurase
MAAERYSADSEKNIEKIRELKKMTISGILGADAKAKIISPENSSPYIVNTAFRGIRSEVLLNHLSGKDIYVSSGSACSSKKKDASHVLKASGVSEEYINGALRISFCNESSAEDVERLISEIRAILPMLNKFRRK